MRNVTRVLAGVMVGSFVAAVSVCAQTPTESALSACNMEGRAAVKAGTTTPPTKDYVRAESARTESTAAWTTWIGPIRTES